jgi:hypothetical protein
VASTKSFAGRGLRLASAVCAGLATLAGRNSSIQVRPVLDYWFTGHASNAELYDYRSHAAGVSVRLSY